MPPVSVMKFFLLGVLVSSGTMFWMLAFIVSPSLFTLANFTAPFLAQEKSDVYHSPEVFWLNYEAMKKRFKVYIYPDGDSNTFYQMPRKLTGKYAGEGYFFKNVRESRFRTNDPKQADLFFIPISCHKMRGKVRY